MQKVARFVGFGALCLVGTALVFFCINALVTMGDVFDSFKADAGDGTIGLFNWIFCVGIAALLIIYVVISVLKLIPACFKGEKAENNSLVHISTVSFLLGGLFFVNSFFTMILLAKYRIDIPGKLIVLFIFAIAVMVLAALVRFMKNMKGLVLLILALVALTLLLVINFMVFEGADGLYFTYLLFLCFSLFGMLGYAVLANLDAFKA